MSEPFHDVYGYPPAGVWAAPGRVNIIGEHTDYNDGYALPIALPYVVLCSAARRDDDRIRVISRQHAGEVAEADLGALDAKDLVDWARYPVGVIDEFVRAGNRLGGLDLLIDGDVPVGAGLSSSAAVECAVALAIRDLFELPVTEGDLIAITSGAENNFVGVPTGRLDQSASLLCEEGNALFLDFGTGARQQVPFDLGAAGLDLLVIDTNAPHALVGGEYAERREQCAAAATALGVRSLREIDDIARLDQLGDDVLRKRARHVVTENARVLAVVDALTNGADPRTIGAILTAGHESLRDDFEVSTIQLDTAVAAALDNGAHGARMVGGGFGGSVIALVDRMSTDSVSEAVVERFSAAEFAAPRLFVAAPASGAHRMR